MKNNGAMQIKDIKEFYTYMTEGWPPKLGRDNQYNLTG